MVNRIAHLFAAFTPDAMPRPTHPKSQLATTIPHRLHEAVRDFADASGTPIAEITEKALRAYLKRQHWPTDEDADEKRW